MSKLYAVVQVCPERHYNYKMDEIRESYNLDYASRSAWEGGIEGIDWEEED